jgi:hypothetical protein
MESGLIARPYGLNSNPRNRHQSWKERGLSTKEVCMGGYGRRILVADDDGDIRVLLKWHLSNGGEAWTGFARKLARFPARRSVKRSFPFPP